MLELEPKIQKAIENTDMTVLILGETGTGKSSLAKAIHNKSRRHAGPYVEVNVSSLHTNTFESEVFGHVKGAYTGAVQNRKGRISDANGGTLFLDEIGELTLEQQGRLLEFLQERRVTPVGGNHPEFLDVRIIAATLRDLDREVELGRFRPDLLFRLRGLVVELPPIRMLNLDLKVHETLEFMFKKYQRTGVLCLEEKLADALGSYSWPGNYRELQTVLEAVTTVADGEQMLKFEHLPKWFIRKLKSELTCRQNSDAAAGAPSSARFDRNFDAAFQQFLAEYLPMVMAESDGRMHRAAQLSGLSFPTFKKYWQTVESHHKGPIIKSTTNAHGLH